MRAQRLSIRGVLYLTVGALTLMIALLVAQQGYRDWQQLAVLRDLRDALLLSDQLFDATDNLAIERDAALSLLRSPDSELNKSLKTRLVEARKAAIDSRRAAVGALDRYAFPELNELRATSTTRLAGVGGLRQRIDRALALPKAERDPRLAEQWASEVAALSAETDRLWIAFIRHFTSIDPIVTQRLRFKHFMRAIIDYTGRERSLIGQLIVENKAPTADQVSALLRGEGAIDISWEMSRVLADQSDLYPAISAQYSDARSHYETLHEMIQDMFYVPGASTTTQYPIAVDLWLEMSTQVTDSLLALRDVATKDAQSYATAKIEAARNRLVMESVAFALALLLCGYSFWVIDGRVVRPINVMIDALLAATRGERVTFAVSTDRNDEMGKLGRVLSAFQSNVEEIKRTAAERDRSQSELRAVVDHAVDGLITIDAEGIVRTFNPACERIFGYGADEIVGGNFKVLMPSAAAGDHAGVPALIGDTLGITGTAGREYVARRKDGTVFPIDLSISAFTLEGGQHFSGIVRDITLRKEAEQELLSYTQALERSNKELDDFAYIASHDLKEPLRGIHNHSRFLLEDNAEKLEKESVERLDRLVYLSQRMERLVNDLLYFSRLGRQELAIQPTDVTAVIGDIEETLETFLEERGGRIVVPSKLPVVVCDKPRVTELFRNLITNAIKYNDKPQKTVEVGWLSTQKTADGALAHSVFYVKDDGRGIAPEFHTEIFRIFKRLQGGKEKEEGTGVGLTFVKKIVERHGGKIWLESAPGQGTTFYFTLEASHDHDFGAQVAA